MYCIVHIVCCFIHCMDCTLFYVVHATYNSVCTFRNLRMIPIFTYNIFSVDTTCHTSSNHFIIMNRKLTRQFHINRTPKTAMALPNVWQNQSSMARSPNQGKRWYLSSKHMSRLFDSHHPLTKLAVSNKD